MNLLSNKDSCAETGINFTYSFKF